jgi:hypothetical protein
MVKYIRKKFPGNARRSKSNAVLPNLPPEVLLAPDSLLLGQRPTIKLRSNSFTMVQRSNKKRRVMKRIIRSKYEADHNELANMLSQATNGLQMKRKFDADLNLDEFEQTGGFAYRPEPSMQIELENTTSTIPGISRKLNMFAHLAPMAFDSIRTSKMFPCFSESEIMTIPPDLRKLFHEGVREEDCDSTDSLVEKGIYNGLGWLGEQLGHRIERRKKDIPRAISEICGEEIEFNTTRPQTSNHG